MRSTLDPAVLDSLLEEDWDNLLDRLILFVDYRVSRYLWRGAAGGVIAKGQDPGGIAADAIQDLLLGRYPWKRSGPHYTPKELWDELMRLAHNRVKALSDYLENRRTESLDKPAEPDSPASGDRFEAAELIPDECAVRREGELALAAVRESLASFLADDPLVADLVECTFRGLTRREEIAADLSVSPQAVTNARKRLERRLRQYALLHPQCPTQLLEELSHA